MVWRFYQHTCGVKNQVRIWYRSPQCAGSHCNDAFTYSKQKRDDLCLQFYHFCIYLNYQASSHQKRKVEGCFLEKVICGNTEPECLLRDRSGYGIFPDDVVCYHCSLPPSVFGVIQALIYIGLPVAMIVLGR